MIERKAGRCHSWTAAFAIVLALLWCGCADKQPLNESSEISRTLEDVIPLTAANIRGHQMLYNEGWFIITSSRKALQYAKAKSIASSGQAIRDAQQRIVARSTEYKKSMSTDIRQSLETGKDGLRAGTDLSGRVLTGTHALAQSEFTYARTTFIRAWEELVQGYLTLDARTEDDRATLVALPGRYYHTLQADFSNIWEVTKSLQGNFGKHIELSWEAAFRKAGEEFRAEYERSGRQANSLVALGPMLYGYLKVLYYGAAAPAAKTIVEVNASGARQTAAAVFLPAASASMVTGRTIQSIGLTVFYTGSTGIKLLSPTVEGGLLSGLALLSLGAGPVTYVGGIALGAINQVAFTTGAPAAATTEAITMSALDTGRYVGFVSYDALTAATKVIINQAASGVVLGYNALSAIPAHLFMGVEDTAILLAWEGPNLILAKITGRLSTRQEAIGEKDAASAGELPVGSVVDLKKLREQKGIDVEIISRDPAVIRDVMQRIPCDAREDHDACPQD